MNIPLGQIGSMCIKPVQLEKDGLAALSWQLGKMQNTTELFRPRAACGNNPLFATQTPCCRESGLTMEPFKHLPTDLNASVNWWETVFFFACEDGPFCKVTPTLPVSLLRLSESWCRVTAGLWDSNRDDITKTGQKSQREGSRTVIHLKENHSGNNVCTQKRKVSIFYSNQCW